jgi:hypothetical protein
MIKNIGIICKKKQGDYEDIKKINANSATQLVLPPIVGLDDLTIEYVQGILEQGILFPAGWSLRRYRSCHWRGIGGQETECHGNPLSQSFGRKLLYELLVLLLFCDLELKGRTLDADYQCLVCVFHHLAAGKG